MGSKTQYIRVRTEFDTPVLKEQALKAFNFAITGDYVGYANGQSLDFKITGAKSVTRPNNRSADNDDADSLAKGRRLNAAHK